MTTVNEYQLWCLTEATYITKWDTHEPMTCPNDSSHTIDPSSIVIIDIVSKTIATVSTSAAGTNNFWKADCYNFPIAAGPDVKTVVDISYPYPVSARASTIYMNAGNVGDMLTVHAAPNTTVGEITLPVASGDTVIHVDSGVVANIFPGFLFHLTDGTNTSDLGEVIYVDQENQTVSVTVGADRDYTNAQVQFTMVRISNMTVVTPGPIKMGQAELGGTHVPAGSITRAIYTNQSPGSKNLNVILELFY